MTKNVTVRLRDEAAADVEAIARVEGTSVNELVELSLVEAVEIRRSDKAFAYRLKQIIEKDQELLRRLAR